MKNYHLNDYHPKLKHGNFIGQPASMEMYSLYRSLWFLAEKMRIFLRNLTKDGDTSAKLPLTDYSVAFEKFGVKPERTPDQNHYQKGSKKFIRSDYKPTKQTQKKAANQKNSTSTGTDTILKTKSKSKSNTKPKPSVKNKPQTKKNKLKKFRHM